MKTEQIAFHIFFCYCIFHLKWVFSHFAIIYCAFTQNRLRKLQCRKIVERNK
uniref:Uncharacterized protein n=1 Tax=Anguilla anguilla TaxID=7936 RepID=A0A0E9PF89_ANGAN